jgi:hypothetical protein
MSSGISARRSRSSAVLNGMKPSPRIVAAKRCRRYARANSRIAPLQRFDVAVEPFGCGSRPRHRGGMWSQRRPEIGGGLSQRRGRIRTLTSELAGARDDGLRVRFHDPEDRDRVRVDLAPDAVRAARSRFQ